MALTRLRISCHSLEIERGRYHKPASIPAHLRLCKDCESVEDELHFVCVCPKYDSLREHLVSIVCNDNPNFVFLSVNDKFLNLMQALDSHVLTALTKFVFMSFVTLYRYVRHYICMTDKPPPPRLSSVNKSIVIIIILIT